MDLIKARQRMISLSLDEIKAIHADRVKLQEFCSEPIDAVLFPDLAKLLYIIDEESHESW